MYSSSACTGRARRVWGIAIEVARIGEKSESPQDSLDSSSVLSEIAENIATFGDAEYARSVAKSVLHDYIRDRTIASVEQILKGEQGSCKY